MGSMKERAKLKGSGCEFGSGHTKLEALVGIKSGKKDDMGLRREAEDAPFGHHLPSPRLTDEALK